MIYLGFLFVLLYLGKIRFMHALAALPFGTIC